MKNIEVRSRKWAKEFVSDKPWAAISISTEKGDFPELKTENRVGLLRLSFWDISNPSFMQIETFDNKLFSKKQAKYILDFVAEVWPIADTLLVHCEAGLSRSPAIAAAISNIYLGDGTENDYFSRYMPNNFVFKTLIEVHYGVDSMAALHAKQLLAEKAYGDVLDEPWDCRE